MESTQDGLTIICDEGASFISFEWDTETHPQWNYIQDLTNEEFVDLLLKQANKVIDNNSENADGQEN